MSRYQEVNIDPNATAREILSAIDTWAHTADHQEVQNMWNILTALRGPDNGDDFLKHNSTIFIRSAVLNNLANESNADIVYGDQQGVLERLGELTRERDIANIHFNNHIIYAAGSILSTEGPNRDRNS